MDVFGETRSCVTNKYALITPDTHVISPLVGWSNTTSAVHIAPELGARFMQYSAWLEPGATSSLPGDGVQRFIYVESGSCSVAMEPPGQSASLPDARSLADTHTLSAGGYVFIPAGTAHRVSCEQAARLVVFEKVYQPHPEFESPTPVVGNANEVVGEPFMGDKDARLQTLLPISPEFDLAVNIFTYQPGATLPQVEVHVMEHGLMMLGGQGVYRLGSDYFPVSTGDVIWMASFCPQWFVAMGKTPASYIYYKDIHRDRLSEKAF